jgi:hypothetical protein
MKVTLPNNNGQKPSKNAQMLPLVPKEQTALTKDNSIGLMLATDPADMANSPKFKMQAYILRGDEEVRTILTWHKDMDKIFHGLDLDTEAKKHQMIENLLTDTALSLYETEREQLAQDRRQTVADTAEEANAGAGAAILAQPLANHRARGDVRNAIKDMISKIMPRRVLARAKRFLRRDCRKPAEMKVRIYLQHLLRINMSELENLPPFNVDQVLSTDELLDIILYGTPKSWQKEMERQGFDPMDHTLNEVVDFMERIESSEDFDTTKPNNQDKSKDKSKNRGKTNRPHNAGTGRNDLFCVYHGECGHTSDDCTILKALAAQKKAKTDNNRSNDRQSDRKSSGNWKTRANDNNNKAKKDLAAFVKKTVKEGVKKELSDKKRKATADQDQLELDLHALEAELASFNYAAMEDLKLEDEQSLASC